MNKRLNGIFKGDAVIWVVFFFLCVVSVVEVFSASSGLTYKSGNYLAPLIKHAGLLLVGVFFMVVTLNIKCKYFRVAMPFLLIFSILTLIWLLLAGESTNGASRWISLLGIQFQPSEIAKGTLVLATAQILSQMQTPDGADPNAMKYILYISGIVIGLVALENLSTAALISAVIFMMMFIGRVPMSQLGKLIGVCVLFIGLALGSILLVGNADAADAAAQTKNTTTQLVETSETEKAAPKERGFFYKIFHRADTWKARIAKFSDDTYIPPEKFDLDKDAQVGHANIAIVKSNVVGRGPGNSEERDFLSQAFSDFIYAIIIEEMGLEGAFFVAFLYIVLLFRTGRIARQCENNFPAFLAMGLALMLTLQALFNMGVAVGLFPVTGQPLPLISKGGTSTIINCVYIGVILSISRTAKKRQKPEELLEPVAEPSAVDPTDPDDY